MDRNAPSGKTTIRVEASPGDVDLSFKEGDRTCQITLEPEEANELADVLKENAQFAKAGEFSDA